MKIIRISFLLMLILTLTLIVTSCDLSDVVEESLPRETYNQLDNLEDRIEREHEAVNSGIQLLNSTQPQAQKEPIGKDYVAFNSSAELTAEDAERIALEHSEVSEAEVKYLRTEPDLERGKLVYEVEFYVKVENRVEPLEYEYTIDAESGAIVEFDIDR